MIIVIFFGIVILLSEHVYSFVVRREVYGTGGYLRNVSANTYFHQINLLDKKYGNFIENSVYH